MATDTEPTDRVLVQLTLRDAVRRHRAQARRLAEAERARDEAIRAAHAGGMPPSEIAKVAGLSKQRVDQIRRGARL